MRKLRNHRDQRDYESKIKLGGHIGRIHYEGKTNWKWE